MFPPANVKHILRRIDCVAIDEEEQTVSLHPTRKLNTERSVKTSLFEILPNLDRRSSVIVKYSFV